MSMEELAERVTRLEEQMKQQTTATVDLAASMRELTALLNKSKGAFWLLTILVGFSGMIGAALAWSVSKLHITLNTGGLP